MPGGSQFSGGEEEGVDAVIVGIGLVVGFGLVNNVIPVSCETVDSIKGGKVDRIVVAVVGTVVGTGAVVAF